MYNIVILLNNKEIYELNKKIYKYQINTNNLNIKSLYKIPNCTITIYNTKKVMFQGFEAIHWFQKLGFKQKDLSNQKKNVKEIKIKPESIKVNCENIQASFNIIGSDEVGVGDFFGGIVVCACYVKKEQIDYLKKIGIKDSKILNDEKIINLYYQIKTIISYKIVEIDPSEYNNWYKKYQNSNILKAILHNDALNQLIEKNLTTPIKIVMDQFASENLYYNYLKKSDIKNIAKVDFFETKAESKYIAVAAASIIARYYFLKQIDKLRTISNLKIPLGSSNPNIKSIAREIMEKHELKNFIKLNFKTVNEL